MTARSVIAISLYGVQACGASTLGGSPNPFVRGASADSRPVGDTDDLEEPLVGGAIRNLQFVTTRE